ncbi:MAG TPA: YfhO family protein [Anaerolineae bacterium]|nr:YfhO family protein [Anaerolineae bacterium]
MLRHRLRGFTQHLSRSLHSDILRASLVLVVLLLVLFWRAIFLGESLLPVDLIYELDPVWQNRTPPGFTAPDNRLLSDVVYFIYPWQVEMRRALSEGRVPLWTPYINNGQPMLANGQVGAWDPFWLVARLFPFHDSFLIVAILKLCVAGLSTFLLARQLGTGQRGALLAMIVFAFGGPLIVWLSYPVSSVMAWLPLLLYLSDRALARQTTTPFLAIGIVLAFQFFSGHPETSLHVLLVWVIFCLARSVTRDGWRVRVPIRLAGRMALAAVIGVALAAAQLLPLAEGILDSSILIRRQASAQAPLLQTALFDWHEWPTLITSLLPQFFGTPIDNSYWYPFQNYNEQTFYAGIVPLALGLITLLAWWGERHHRASARAEPSAPQRFSRGFWIGLALLALGIAAQLPLINLVNALPLVRLINNGRLRIVYVLALALLAGHGLDSLAKNNIPSWPAPRRFLIVLGALATAGLIAVGGAYLSVTALRDPFIAMGRSQAEAMKAIDHPLFPYSLDYYYERVNIRYAQTQRLYMPATPEMFLPAGVALLASGLNWIRRRTGNQALWLNGLVLLTCADLFIIGARLNPFTPPALSFPTTEAVDFLKRQPGLFRVSGLYLALMPNTSMVFGLSDARGYDAVVPWRHATLLQRVEGAYQLNHYGLLRSANSRLLDLMNVEYVITDRALSGRWEPAFSEGGSSIRVYRNPSVLPRAFIVYQFEPAPSAEAALSRVLDENFDFRTQVILEGMPPDLSSAPESPQTGEARIVNYESERVAIETDTPVAGILVLTDTYAPGWQAQIDGQPTEIYIADYAFRAVRVPAGQHRIEFTYAPASFTVGAILSLTALAGGAIYVVVRLYRRTR